MGLRRAGAVEPEYIPGLRGKGGTARLEALIRSNLCQVLR
jgi:hypothetical protein